MVSLVGGVAAACGSDSHEPRLDPACWTLARLPGPEDLVIDPGLPRRLLVSSQDRRLEPRPKGGIWSVPLDPGQHSEELKPASAATWKADSS